MKKVTLGKCGLMVSRIGIGTGSRDGIVQRDQGHDNFVRMIRHAFDRGLTYIDTSPVYHTFWWIRDAIAGLPREGLFLQCKIGGAVIHGNMEEVLTHFLKTLGVDYLDSVLLHCMSEADWPVRYQRQIEELMLFRECGYISSLGFSCHNLPAMRSGLSQPWVDILFARFNPAGMDMDGETGMGVPPSVDLVEPVRRTLDRFRKFTQTGCVAMKLFANGNFNREQREQSYRFVFGSGLFDAAVVGFKSVEEVDEFLTYGND